MHVMGIWIHSLHLHLPTFPFFLVSSPPAQHMSKSKKKRGIKENKHCRSNSSSSRAHASDNHSKRLVRGTPLLKLARLELARPALRHGLVLGLRVLVAREAVNGCVDVAAEGFAYALFVGRDYACLVLGVVVAWKVGMGNVAGVRFGGTEVR